MVMETHDKVRSFDAEMLLREGQQLQDNHAFTKALESYQRAATLEPSRPELHFRIGIVLSKLGRWADAASAYLEAIRLNPEYTEAHVNLGFVYYEMGLDQQAQEMFERARSLGGLANPAGK